MKEQIKLLIDLQKIDSEILSTRLKIDTIPEKINSLNDSLKNIEKSYDTLKQSHSLLEMKKKEKELEIEEIKEKKKKLIQRSSEIKSNKEYQAHLKEIEKTDNVLKDAEEDLLEILESIEKSSKELEKEKMRLAEDKQKIDIQKKELEKEALNYEAEITRLKEERKKIADKLEKRIYEEYMNLLKIGKGLAVAEAKDEICQGCNMHIPPQLFVEIKKGEKIIDCPQCKRILYYLKQIS